MPSMLPTSVCGDAQPCPSTPDAQRGREHLGHRVWVVVDHGDLGAHVQLEIVEAVAGGVADPAELLLRGGLGGVRAHAPVDHAGGEVDVDPDDVGLACASDRTLRPPPATSSGGAGAAPAGANR